MDNQTPRPDPYESALREVIRQPGSVIHVAVRQAYILGMDGFARRAPDVEAHIELRHHNDGLLARD